MVKYFIIIFCVLMLYLSCSTKKALFESRNIKTDTVFLYHNVIRERIDTLTVQMYDTLRVKQQGDTIILEKIRDRIMYRNKITNDTLVVRDTVFQTMQNIDNKETIKETINFKVVFILAGIIVVTVLFIYFKIKK